MRHLTVVGLVAVVVAAVLLPSIASAHERKEVAGLMVLFGAEPEPALTGQVESLVWRFQSKDSEEPFGDLEEASAVIRRDGTEYGPFDARRARRDPSRLQTRHIFTVPGEYEVVLTFKKKGSPEVHTIAFAYRIRDRRDIEIP